jgi:cellulose synthase/poly-beta-1,6-N-acetylglucosamine synthase-like glycosyltransferase
MGLKYFMLLWQLVQILIGYNLIFPVFIFLIYFLVPKPKKKENISDISDYAIIVTAYEQTLSIGPVVASILKLTYKNYLVYIVADKCDITELNFDDERVILLRPEETLSSNTRSHFYAINRFKRAHNRITIIDSDNLVDPEYLTELNVYFQKGFSAIQGVRNAKNMDTVLACLDAARDIYYQYYVGKILFEAGSSATLSGSGMAFTTSLYKECLEYLDITGAGFDKILQKEIVERGYRIAFAEKAILYDEKTSQSDQFVNQRARWINTWFRYFKFGFKLVAKGITRFNWNQFLFGLVLLRPPLFIFLLISVLFMLVDIIISPVQALIWLIGFVIFIAGFLFALLMSDTDKRIYKSLWGIPKFMFFQVLSLLKMRKANEISIATQHYHDNEILDLKK